jgi:hypothetical protein
MVLPPTVMVAALELRPIGEKMKFDGDEVRLTPEMLPLFIGCPAMLVKAPALQLVACCCNE